MKPKKLAKKKENESQLKPTSKDFCQKHSFVKESQFERWSYISSVRFSNDDDIPSKLVLSMKGHVTVTWPEHVTRRSHTLLKVLVMLTLVRLWTSALQVQCTVHLKILAGHKVFIPWGNAKTEKSETFRNIRIITIQTKQCPTKAYHVSLNNSTVAL